VGFCLTLLVGLGVGGTVVGLLLFDDSVQKALLLLLGLKNKQHNKKTIDSSAQSFVAYSLVGQCFLGRRAQGQASIHASGRMLDGHALLHLRYGDQNEHDKQPHNGHTVHENEKAVDDYFQVIVTAQA
jgi:hypothetical protein